MGRHNGPRTKMAVPVRLFLTETDGNQNMALAHTLDANNLGARLGGVHVTLTKGQVITVQYQHRRCTFRVVWVGERGTPTATQVGLECLDPSKNIWGVELPGRIPSAPPVGRHSASASSAAD
jgi:hypothetical protein